MSKKLIFKLTFLTLVIFLGYFLYSSFDQNSFYAKELSKNNILETVSIGEVQYEVVSGVIKYIDTENFLNEVDKEKILKLAYAKSLARRDPLLGISGVDANKLKNTTKALAQTQKRLAAAQDTPEEARLINTLYPINFLNSLALMEESRQKFLFLGTEDSKENYYESIKNSARKGVEDVVSFRDSLSLIIGEEKFKILSLGGTITSEALVGSLDTIEIRMREILLGVERLSECTKGNYNNCENNGLTMDFLEIYEIKDSNKNDNKEQLELNIQKEVIDIFSEVVTNFEERMIIRLSSSSCLSSIQGPYYFSLNQGDKESISVFEYVGDIFFNPTEGSTGETNIYLRDVYDINFLKISSTIFYNCPDTLNDLGILRALKESILLAKRYPIYLSNKCDIVFGGNIFHECETLNYLNTIHTLINKNDSTFPIEVLRKLETIHNMFKERSAGLDDLVLSIASVNNKNLESYLNGVPFDVTAKILFTVRSAFPSLYLTHNSSAGDTPFVLRELNSDDASLYLSKIERYSDSRSSIESGKIVSDVYNFYKYEKGDPIK